MQQSSGSSARRLWEAVEPVHATVYFAPEPAEAAKALGLKGWWMGYFAGRAAPLGAIGPEPVTAMFFGFAPGMVARALPDAWALAPPGAVLASRFDAVAGALHRLVPEALLGCVEELNELLDVAVSGCRFDGRPLAAAWAAEGARPPSDPVARLWLSTTILREHRGDGHVAAAIALGLGGLDTSLTMVATGAVAREALQPNRGWTDEEWEASAQRLRDRGLLRDDGGLTPAGWALRNELEETTNHLADGPVRALGEAGAARLVELAGPIGRHLFVTNVIPEMNPIGVPKP